MIFSEVYRYFHISIPKTGSWSIRDWLCKNYGGRKMLDWGEHSHCVPAIYSSYTVFTTVRNPYDRCYSFYKHLIFKGTFKGTLLEFLKYLSARREEVAWVGVKLFATQSQYVERAGVTHVVKLENLDELLALPFVDKEVMPWHLNKGVDVGLSYIDYYGEKEDRALQEYCCEDFDNFKYDRIYWGE